MTWYYYGAKTQLGKHYPKPLYDTIIEPFAGSAGYAQRYRNDPGRKVILVEKDPLVADLWRWMQTMTAEEILGLPTPIEGEYCDDPLLDRLVKMAAASNGVSRMTGPLKVPKRVVAVWPGMLKRMADRVDAVRDWKIIEGDYTRAPKKKATWFIDPPYQVTTPTKMKTAFPKGQGYRHNLLDYDALRDWVRGLKGQVIVCEQEGADWLAGFESLKMAPDSQGKARHEVFVTWHREK